MLSLNSSNGFSCLSPFLSLSLSFPALWNKFKSHTVEKNIDKYNRQLFSFLIYFPLYRLSRQFNFLISCLLPLLHLFPNLLRSWHYHSSPSNYSFRLIVSFCLEYSVLININLSYICTLCVYFGTSVTMLKWSATCYTVENSSLQGGS